MLENFQAAELYQLIHLFELLFSIDVHVFIFDETPY